MIGIVVGDARELGSMLPSGSVDLVFTDPPYGKEHLGLYGWLFSFAARVLRPSGFLLCYVGGYWKDRVMAMAREWLDYFWDFTVFENGPSPVIKPRRVITRGKSILAYRPRGGVGMPQTNVLGIWNGGKRDKRFHPWGQDENTVKYYVESFSPPGAFVVDPFCGGGTVPLVCKGTGRDCLAFELDFGAAAIARRRLEDSVFALFGQGTLWSPQGEV